MAYFDTFLMITFLVKKNSLSRLPSTHAGLHYLALLAVTILVHIFHTPLLYVRDPSF